MEPLTLNSPLWSTKDNGKWQTAKGEQSNLLPLSFVPCPVVVTNCVNYLTGKAIASSVLIASLEDKIKNTGEQINYLEDKVRYYKSRNWTNFITLEPVKLIQNIFGGGDVQRNQLTITDIETKINQLKDNQDRLENQLIIEKDNIKNEVAIALLNIEESQQRIKLYSERVKT